MSEQLDEAQSGDYLYTIDFQKGILKILASNVKFAVDYGNLVKPEYFETHSLKVIAQLIRDSVLAYEKEVDATQLTVLITNYVTQFGLAEETSKVIYQDAKNLMATHIKSEQFYIDNLLKFARRQELKAALFQAVEVMERDGDYDSVLALIDKAVSVGAGADDGLTFNDLLTLPTTYYKKYDPLKLITTGFATWDKALEGGMAPGELHTVIAPPKTGKSSLGVCVGTANLRRGRNVFHISLEISKEDVGMKYFMNMTGLTKEQIQRMKEEEYQFKVKKYEQYKSNLFINFWPESSINTSTIRAWISRVRTKTGISPDLIVVDYDDCLVPTGGTQKSQGKDDMYGNSGQIFTDLIVLANYFNCPVLTFSQPQRDSWENANDGKLITMDKMAHSAKKAHKAFGICSLNFTDDSPNGILFVDVLRRGESKVKVKVKKDLSRCWIFEDSKP